MVGPKDERGAKKMPGGFGLVSKLKNKLPSRSSGASKGDNKIYGNTSEAEIDPSISIIKQSHFNHDNKEPSREAFSRVASLSAPIHGLWNQAYDELREKEYDLINGYEAALREIQTTAVASTANIGREEQMKIILKGKVDEVGKSMWKLRFGSNEVPVQDLMAPLISIIDWANDYINAAMSSNPYGSIAWAGVSLLLPLLLNPSKQAASLAKGLEYISGLIVQSSMREDLYSRRYETKQSGQYDQGFSPSHKGYRDTLKELYTRILKLQAASVCYYSKHTTSRVLRDMIRWDDWDSLLESIQTQEAAFQSVYELSKDAKYEEDCLVSEKRHQEGMKSLENIGVDLSGLRKAVEEAEMNKQRRELLAWLSSIDPSENYNSARDIHESKTSKWLVEDCEGFRGWKTAGNSFLWLHGKAGSGKSVLSSSVIKHLQDVYFSDPCTAIGFFYLSFNDVKKQSTVGMLESLIKQLCCRRPDTPQSLADLSRYKEQGHRPDMKTLESTLAATMHGFLRVYLVIDALDECPSGNGERTKLLGCLRRIHAAKSNNLHLFCTSRKETDIETCLTPLLSSPSGVTIDLSDYKDAVSGDISLYIDQTLETSDYDSWPDTIKMSARTALISKADGMFQYVSCQFDALRGLSSAAEIQLALDNLPENLDSTYDRMLEQINARYWKQVTGVLVWLAFSLRPLYLQELAEIFILNYELPAPLDEKSRLFKPEEVLKHLPGLVTAHRVRIRKRRSAWYSEEVFEIKFAHFSIKEYLISKRMRQNLLPIFCFTENSAHLHIANTCLAYHLQMSSQVTVTRDTIRRFALSEYASKSWTEHLEHVDRILWTEAVIERVLQVLKVGGQGLKNVVRFDYLYRSGYDMELAVEEILSPLHYIAYLGAFEISKLLISNGADINAKGGRHGTALQAAAVRRHVNIVQLLLDHGADVNISGGLYGSALKAAARNGHESIVRLLLDHGANVNISGGLFGSALQAAASSGYESIVRLLLDYGADVNISGGLYGNALQAAASSGYESIVRLLLDHGADINAEGGRHGTALQAAAVGRHVSIIQFLLDHGADVNAIGGEYGTALQYAAYDGLTSVMQPLLDAGADVNIQGGNYGNALIAAVHKNRFAIVERLLNCGAEVNMRGGRFGNALQTAVAFRCIDLIQLLLSHGAKMDPPGGKWEEFIASFEGQSVEVDRLRRFRENPTEFLAGTEYSGS